jgi:uncharacterized protein (TIGR03083 family)
MPLEPLLPVDTRPLFRPVSSALVNLLRQAAPADWDRPTVAGEWLVRDVVAHLLDTTVRRLSFHRDRMTPPPPPAAIDSERDFVAFINGLNAQWVTAARRLSPRVLADLYARASAEQADWFESQRLDGPALFSVSWAGEITSENWFDIGREFTELWHHQQQIRMALGAAALPDPRLLRAVIDVAVRGLPHAYRDVGGIPGQTVVIDVTGPAGGQWTLVRVGDRWTLSRGATGSETARVRLDQDLAWKVLFNAARGPEAVQGIRISGDADLAGALLRARSVIV